MMFWVEFEEACDVCGILRGGHHHSTGEPGCCFEDINRPRHRVILPIAGDSFEEAEEIACLRGMVDHAPQYDPSESFEKTSFTAWMKHATIDSGKDDYGFQVRVLCMVGSEFERTRLFRDGRHGGDRFADEIAKLAPASAIELAKHHVEKTYREQWEGIGKE